MPLTAWTVRLEPDAFVTLSRVIRTQAVRRRA